MRFLVYFGIIVLTIGFFTGAAIFVGGLKFVSDSPDLSSIVSQALENQPLITGQQTVATPVTISTAPPVQFNDLQFKNLGFQITIPSVFSLYDGACKKEGDVYVLDFEYVPTKVFEETDYVVIGPTYRYTFSDANARNTSSTECAFTESTAESLQEDFYSTWIIHSKTVRNDEELTRMIKEFYGQDCSLGTKAATQHEETFDVEVAGHVMDGAVDCEVNFKYAFKYSPTLQRAATWKMSQEAKFLVNSEYTDSYDLGMEQSFRFLP